MASKFTIHNGIESNSVNDAINFTVPVTFGGVSLGVSLTGVARFVNADTGVDAGDGKQASDPFATIQHAIDTSAEGDVIVVAPGTYAENVVVDVDYLTIVGAVGGYGRPDVAPASGLALSVQIGRASWRETE